MAYKINKDECVGCGACKDSCPVDCISQDGDKYRSTGLMHPIRTCGPNCPPNAIDAE
jgi:MinD superfamily P-loop ATPase